jgi:hypothetical protein
MNQSEDLLIENHYHQLVEDCLNNILIEHWSGQSKNSPEKHETLCQSYRNLLKSNLTNYFKILNHLSTTELESVLMRMDNALFRQYLKNNEHKQVAYLIQLHIDQENSQDYFKSNHSSIRQSSKESLEV